MTTHLCISEERVEDLPEEDDGREQQVGQTDPQDLLGQAATEHRIYEQRHMALEILINTGSGNGLLPDSTKPLFTWTNVDLSSVRSCGIHLRTLS